MNRFERDDEEPTNLNDTEVGAGRGGVRRRVLEAYIQSERIRFELPDSTDKTVTLSLGRSRSNDVSLQDPTVSRQHAILTLRDGWVSIRRVEGSRARLRVGSTAVDSDGEVSVALGAPFALGDVVLVVREERVSPTTSAVQTQGGILFRSSSMQVALAMVDRVAPSAVNVLVRGETGTGKELVARAIHDRSPRARQPFIAINCAALPPNLLEAELFGFERGAFSGAVASKPGLFEAAHQGTLMLDEIGELALDVQAKLLRVLESGEILRVGSVKPRVVDVRVVSATHRDLAAMVEAGTFRRDLFYRVHGVSVELPPLRERLDDLELLAVHFAKVVLRGEEPVLSAQALEALRRHRWPGNARELRNVMERAVLLSGGGRIDVVHLQLPNQPAPAMLNARVDASVANTVAPPALGAATGGSLKENLRAIEREQIIAALEQCGGNQSQAAILLGMPRRTLVAKIAELGLTKSPRAKRE
ncbi:MAG: sigma 54-interacting transcriptional regulator [Myxococcales bacterium]|nr:sigma 54-interacting transcriptional regulator [Myxococcales bacterium]